MFEIIWNTLSFIVALGLLVTVHEYGHFWVARKCNVKVERFSVGFGKTLFKTYDKHGTEFVIALIPLGGYVKMLDERVADVDPADKPFAFNNKTVYQRMAIVAAGPIANFLFAIFAFYLMFLIGIDGVKPIIGKIEDNSIAAQAQMQPGAQIVAVNEHKTADWQAVNMALVSVIGDDAITISAKANDSTYIKQYQLNSQNWSFEPSQETSMQSLGIVPYMPKILPTIGALIDGEAGAKGGLQIGDEIISVNGKKLDGNWQGFVDMIQQNPNQLVSLQLLRNEKVEKINLVVGTRGTSDGLKSGYLGVSPTIEPWPEDYKVTISYGPIEAIGKAFESTWRLITLSFNMIGKLFTGVVGVENLSGPISIAQGAGSSAGVGVAYFLSFLALISVNLGIINLLPLPILDGGHLFYYVIELIRGRPVPEKVQEVGFKFGAIILLSLMSIALFNDISRL
ncbi:sigma E protease regulator RseP [Thalassotalea aquiviva]|uniref:sigma E protease regulator RseP n=1 Tax=Thalassotalea aquiviva TaxID=3242415 RepID=UPI00352AC413